jgi:sugar fermentation stimulation protein A
MVLSPVMIYTEPLKEGRFRRRYKRFFAEIDCDGEILTAHVPNTGSLKGCLHEGAPCRFTVSSDPSRKIPFTLQMVQDGTQWVGINTMAANIVVWKAWQERRIPDWLRFDACQKEVRLHAKTRLDLALWQGNDQLPATERLTEGHLKKHRLHFVEIKNVTMAVRGTAMFPDSVTTRGQKHLEELIALKEQGHSSELVFLVQRSDCRTFAPADEIDPTYGKLLRNALNAGVKISAFPCEVTKKGICLSANPLEINLISDIRYPISDI